MSQGKFVVVAEHRKKIKDNKKGKKLKEALEKMGSVLNDLSWIEKWKFV